MCRGLHFVATICSRISDLLYSLKNHGVDEEVDAMFDMGRETLALPLEEKMKMEQGNDGVSHG